MHLKEVAFAINTSVQSTTEKMPFEVVFCRKPRTPLDNALCWPADRQQSFEEFQSRVNDLRREVKIRIIEKQSKVKALADLRRQVMEPLKPGEMVLVRRKPKKKGKTKKFLPKFTGPFQVVNQVGSGDILCPTTYLVEDTPERRTRKKHRRFNAHVAQIRKFRQRNVIFDEEEEEQIPETPKPVPQPVVSVDI
jgi:hypothetical protein